MVMILAFFAAVIFLRNFWRHLLESPLLVPNWVIYLLLIVTIVVGFGLSHYYGWQERSTAPAQITMVQQIEQRSGRMARIKVRFHAGDKDSQPVIASGKLDLGHDGTVQVGDWVTVSYLKRAPADVFIVNCGRPGSGSGPTGFCIRYNKPGPLTGLALVLLSVLFGLSMFRGP